MFNRRNLRKEVTLQIEKSGSAFKTITEKAAHYAEMCEPGTFRRVPDTQIYGYKRKNGDCYVLTKDRTSKSTIEVELIPGTFFYGFKI